jgi:hypothetical protein
MDINKDIKIDFNTFDKILNYFKTQKYTFINPALSNNIKKAINILFPNLNNQDSEVLFLFTENIIEKISNYFYFDKTNDDYYKQWIQNNYRDIKGIILLLLPFIDDKNTTNMIDLNQYLYTPIKSKIPDLSKKNRMDILKSEFKFSNMSIGLLDKTSLDLFEEDGKMKLIYKIIHHNYLGLNRTLQIMNGKYYVNWINIVPILYSYDENKLVFKESKLYNKTKDGLDLLKRYLNNPKEFFNFTQHNYYGLYLGDIYNTIKIKLYDEIKHIKWLIFPLPLSTGNIYIIQYLNRQINFDNFFKYSSYEDIESKDKINFKKFIQTTYTNMENNLMHINLWTQILLFFTNEYSQKNVVKKEISDIFQKFSFSPSIKESEYIDEENDEEYIKSIHIKISKITASDIIEYLSKINPKHIWNFLYETIKLLENTYLRDYFIKETEENGENKKTINDTINYYYRGTNLSFKNIYNIAKSITHFENNNNEWISHDSHYVSFTLEQELRFFKKFLDVENYTTWLNLRNNLKREFNINNDIQYNEKMNNINSDWNKIKLDLIFEILTKNGILSEFNVVLDITDKNNYMKSIQFKPQIYKKMETRMKENKKWKQAYYYLTNQQYSKLPKLNWENEKTKEKKDYFYFDLFSKDQNWYSFYAMDWLSQINFFHHYIHHRVLYVTGATGQGKSTQVPKLLMYALKAYEMKNDGKVVCTQPRIPPTKNNAERISEELGVPIVRALKKSMEKEKTDNFYVQMKYSEDSHLKDNCPHLILKILTDGTLYEELQNNPMMKEQISNIGKDFIYGYKNKYDVIILDESHEHNTNMDMILTLIRQSCFYNNSLRLIIMSATMDEDEPIYRSYFRCINDDLIYPIKAPLYQHPILSDLLMDNTCVPDTIYMDRRFHISPPGETTQYIVSEYYTENLSIEKLTDEEASILTQEESYKIISDICQKYPTGEILLFLTGKEEIKKAIKKLNEILPQGNIALPYYSQLHSFYKDIIEKIHIKLYTIKNKRENVYLEWSENYTEDLSVPDGIYKRAIIVATNVAEASITINTLKFIVDTGYAKVNSFNPATKLTKLNIEKIAEASRIQRKGRVGRVSDGIAYFVYPKKSRENVQPKYKITQEELSQMYLKLLCSESTISVDDYIFLNDYNPNFFNSSSNNFYSNIISKEIENKQMFKKNIINILIKQYSIENNIINKNNYWNKKYYPDIIIKNDYLNRTYTGQRINALSDYNGNFYIIHPKENLIIRNINNEIIQYTELKQSIIPPNVFDKEIEILNQRLILIDTNYNSNIFNVDYNSKNYVKSELYKKILELEKIINNNLIEYNDYLTIFASIAFDCMIEVLSIIILIKTIETINKLIDEKKIENFYNIWYSSNSSNSELFILHNIIEKFKCDNSNLLVFKIMKNREIIKEVDEIVNNKILNFKKYYKLNLNNIPDFFKNNIEDWNLIKKLFNSGKLETKDGINEIKFDILIKQIKENLILNDAMIKKWCDTYFINYEYITSFLFKLGEMIIKMETINVDFLVFINSIKHNFLKILKTNTIKEKILKSFILGNPLNYAIKLDFNNNFYNLHLFNTKAYIKNNKNLSNSFSNIIFYYNYTENMNDKNINLNIINDVELEYFTSCLPYIFNKNNFKKIIPILTEHKSFIEIYGSNYEQIISYINNNSFGMSPWENDEMPIISNYFKKLKS